MKTNLIVLVLSTAASSALATNNVECVSKFDAISFRVGAANSLVSDILQVNENMGEITYPRSQVTGFWLHGKDLKVLVMDENADHERIMIDTKFNKATGQYKGKVTFDSGGSESMIDTFDVTCTM